MMPHNAFHMKKTLYLAALASLCLPVLGGCGKSARIAADGTCRYTVVCAADAAPAEKTAVEELVRYIGIITGDEPAVVQDDTAPADGREIIVGTTSRDIPRVQACRDTLGGEGFAILWDGKRVYVTGSGENDGRGTLYGAYELLRDFGCEFYATDTETVPSDPSLRVKRRDRVEKPVFEYRDVYWSAVWDKALSAKLHRNGNLAGQLPKEYGGGVFYAGPRFVHSFVALVPPEQYFATHPEYFSEIDGVRTARHLYSQLCMTNEEVFHIALAKVREWLAEKPDARIVSVSQNDSFVIESYCTCPACKAIIDEEGSPMGPLLRFVNRVADSVKVSHPQVAVDLLAYQYSIVPPSKTVPRENVIVRYCTGGCQGHPIATCPNNTRARENILNWNRICNRIYIWDYTTNFAQYLCPLPNFYTLKENINFFKDNGVKGVFEQGMYQGGASGEFGELRAYLLAKLLWNPSLDTDALIDGFMAAYYGPGAPMVRSYFDWMHRVVAEDGRHIPINLSCVNLYEGLISDEDLERIDRLWEEAAAACGEDTQERRHVRAAGLSWRFYKKMSGRGEWADEAGRQALEQQFNRDCNELGVTRLNESALIPWVDF